MAQKLRRFFRQATQKHMHFHDVYACLVSFVCTYRTVRIELNPQGVKNKLIRSDVGYPSSSLSDEYYTLLVRVIKKKNEKFPSKFKDSRV